MQNTFGNGEKTEVTSEESEKPIIMSGEINAAVAEMMPSNGGVGSMETKVTTDSSIGQSSVMRADSLTNISIGGLLAEAPLQGGFGNYDPESTGTTAGLQSSQVIFDSFDAFLAGQINSSQNPRVPPQNSLSSI